MTSKRDDTHLPEPQKGAITSKREAVKLELQKGGREEGSRQGGPTQMGEVQRLVMKWSLITIAIRNTYYVWYIPPSLSPSPNTPPSASPMPTTPSISLLSRTPSPMPRRPSPENDLHLKPWSCCEEINGKWLQTPAASKLQGGEVVQVTKAERSQSLQPRQGGQLEYDEIG